jgi:hypothetical protein
VTIQLRYLQTLIEVSNNQSSTIIFPLPIDVLQPLKAAAAQGAQAGQGAQEPEPARLEEAMAAARAAIEAGTDEPADFESAGLPTSRASEHAT